MTNWIRYFMSRDLLRSPRHVTPPLVTYFWDGEKTASIPQTVKNISATGMYLLTDRRWYPGTLVTFTLQSTDKADADSANAITVLAKAIWSGADGMGFRFLFAEKSGTEIQGLDGSRLADRKQVQQFLRQLRGDPA